VFKQYDAGNRLLGQAQTEVLQQELDVERLTLTLQHLATLQLDVVDLKATSPFALPLMVDRLREQLSTEKLKDKLTRLLAQAEAELLATPQAVAAGSAGSPAATLAATLAATPPAAKHKA
jgi:ATP-dependent helicase Lhr and Lhr-like helicase